jgi:CBS domain-containing protein
MRDSNVGCLVVEAGGTVIGVITDRDLATRCSAQGHDPCQCQVQHHMTSPAITVEPTVDVLDAARIMLNHRMRRLPVTLCDQLVGLVSLSDIEQEMACRPEV